MKLVLACALAIATGVTAQTSITDLQRKLDESKRREQALVEARMQLDLGLPVESSKPFELSPEDSVTARSGRPALEAIQRLVERLREQRDELLEQPRMVVRETEPVQPIEESRPQPEQLEPPEEPTSREPEIRRPPQAVIVPIDLRKARQGVQFLSQGIEAHRRARRAIADGNVDIAKSHSEAARRWLEAARADLTEATAANPTLADLFDLARCQELLGKVTEARRLYAAVHEASEGVDDRWRKASGLALKVIDWNTRSSDWHLSSDPFELVQSVREFEK